MVRLYFEKRTFWFLCFAILALIGLGLISYVQTQRLIDAAQSIPHANQVIRKSEAVLKTLVEVETGARGYVITGDSTYLTHLHEGLAKLPKERSSLAQLVQASQEQKAQWTKLEQLMDSKIKSAHVQIALRKNGMQPAVDYVEQGEGRALMDSIRTMIKAIQDEERPFFREHNPISNDDLRWFQNALLGTAALIVITLALLIRYLNREFRIRKEAETLLSAASSEILDLYNNAPCGYHSIDANGLVLDMNRTELNWLGYTAAEVINKMSIREILTEDSQSVLEANFSVFKERGVVNNVELNFLRKDGSTFPALINATAIYDAQGNFSKSRTVVFDNTTRHNIERRFRQLLESSPDIQIVSKEDGVIYMVNARAVKSLGYSREELIGQKIEMLLPEGFREAHIAQRASYYPNAAPRHRKGGMEFTVLRKDGTIFPAEISLSPVKTEDGTLVISAIRDVSERLKIEERIRFLATIADNIQDPVITVNTEAAIKSWNNGAERLFGWKQEEVQGLIMREILKVSYPATDRDEVVKQHTEKGFWQGEINCETRAGNSLTVLVTSSALKDLNGHTTGALILMHDITQQREHEKQIALLARMVENTNEAMYSLTTDFKVLSWNKGAEKIYGFTAEEMIGRSIGDFIRTNLSEEERARLRGEVIKSDKWRDEVEVFRKDGRLVNLMISTSAIKNETGQLTGFVIIARDITDRKEAERKIQYLATITNNIEDAVIVTDLELTIKNWNHAAERILGWKQSEIIGQKNTILGTQYMDTTHEAAIQVLRETGSWSGEITLTNKAGQRMYFLVTYSLMKDDRNKLNEYLTLGKDITQIKKDQETMRSLARMVESTNEGMYSVTSDFKVVTWNKGAEDIYGFSREEVIGRSVYDFIRSTMTDEQRTKIREKIKTSENWHDELEHFRKDGSLVNILASTSALKDASGKTVGYVSIARDITDRKEAEKQIRLLAAIANNIQDVIITTDIEFKITRWNSTAERILGWKESEVVGQHGNILSAQYPDTSRELVFKSIVDNGYWDGELVATGKSGEPRNFMVTYSTMKDDRDKITGYLILARDITQRKEAEKQIRFLAAIASSIEDVVMVTDSNFIITKWNSAAERILGWKESELIGKPASTLHVNNLNTTSESVHSAISENGFWSGEAIVPSKDGKPNYFSTTYCSIKNENGEVVGFLVLARDITQQKETEKEVRFLAAIANNIEDVVVVIDFDFKVTRWNSAAERILGWKEAEILGQPTTIFKTQYPYTKRDLAIQAIQDQGYWDGEIIITGKFGGQHHFMATYSSMKDDQNNTTGYLILARDITQRKETEKEIRFLANIANNIEDVIIVYDLDFKFTRWNSASERLLGWKESEVLGQTSAILQTQYLHTKRELALQAIRENGYWDGEVIVTRKSGEQRNFMVTYSSMKDVRDNVTGYLVLGRDITEMKHAEKLIIESEKRFAALFNQSPVMKAISEISTSKYLEVNAAFAQFIGRPPEEMVGKTSVELNMSISPEARERALNQVKQFGLIRDMEMQVTTANGEKKWVSINSSIIKLDGVDRLLSAAVDITQRKKIEQELEILNKDLESRIKQRSKELVESEAFNRGVINALDAHIAVIDQDGVIISVNENWSNFAFINGDPGFVKIGKGANYLEACRKAARSGDLSADEALTGIEKVLAGDLNFFEMEYPCHAPHEHRWFTMRTNRFGTEKAMAIIAHTNITKRKLVEIQIAENEERFRSIYETSLDAILLTKTDGTILSANAAACKMFGRTEAEIIQSGRNELVDSNDERFNKGLDDRMQTGRLHGIWKHLRKDGSKFWGEVSSATFQSPDGEERASVFIRDISDRLLMQEMLTEKEQQLQLFVKNSPAALAMFDRDMHYIMTSDRYVSDYKLKGAQLIGQSHYEVFPDISEYWKEIHQRCLAGATEKMEEDGFVRADGSVDWVRWEIVPWYKSGGEIGGIILMSENITDRKKAEEEIRQLNETLERKVELRTTELKNLNKELEAFSYSISHDLRAPLRAIDGYARILEEDFGDKLNDEGRHFISTITRNSIRMGKLIDDMLNLSQVGRVEISPAVVNMNDVVYKVIADLAESMGEKLPEVRITELYNCRADVDLITQVWFNYISNAYKYSSKKSNPVVEIGSTNERDRVVYYVKDNGSGFDNKYVGKLFGVFQRLHKLSEFDGTGVGLAIVKRIVEKHGGQVWAQGIPDAGATFYFSLPKISKV